MYIYIYYILSCCLINHVFVVIHFPFSDFSRNLQEIQEQAGEYYG